MPRRPHKRRWCFFCDQRTFFPLLHCAVHLLDILLPSGNPELVFHGADCPGHTTGLPGASCLKI